MRVRPPVARQFVIALVASLSVALAGCASDPQTTAGAAKTPPSMPVPVADTPTKGPADAWVTIVEFSDFECPYCGKAAPTVAQVLAAYPLDVRLSYRYFPLAMHPHAMPAAVAAECARAQGKFWEMHDQLFAHQEHLEATDLPNYATAIGLDLAAWEACRLTPAPVARVLADQALGLQMGVKGTPTFVFNGEPLVGALPYTMFTEAVDGARTLAAASGIARAEYYEKVVLGK